MHELWPVGSAKKTKKSEFTAQIWAIFTKTLILKNKNIFPIEPLVERHKLQALLELPSGTLYTIIIHNLFVAFATCYSLYKNYITCFRVY